MVINKYFKNILIAVITLVFFISFSLTNGLDLWNDDSYLNYHKNAEFKKGFASVEQLEKVFPNSLTPSDFLRTFNLSEAQKEGNYGEGETIAILSGNGYFNLDTYKKFSETFANQYPLLLNGEDPIIIEENGKETIPDKSLVNKKIVEDGETLLDVEWAHVIAPKAKLIVINDMSNQLKNIIDVFKKYHVNVVSSSIENSATQMLIRKPFGLINNKIDHDLIKPESIQWIASNYPMFVASGDYGQYVNSSAIASNAVLVGGIDTNLYNNINDTKNYETWNNEGYGTAVNLAVAPGYQKQVLHTSSTWRQIPDVVWLAGYPGVSVYSKNGWFNVGGTSLAAPLFSALWSLADNAHKKMSGYSLPSNANQVLYTLAKNYPDSFSKYVSNNDSDKWSAVKWGLGFPNPNAFVKNLSTYTNKSENINDKNLMIARIPFSISFGVIILLLILAAIMLLFLIPLACIGIYSKLLKKNDLYVKVDNHMETKRKYYFCIIKMLIWGLFIIGIVNYTNQIAIQFKTYSIPGNLFHIQTIEPNRMFIFGLICIAVLLIEFKLLEMLDYIFNILFKKKITQSIPNEIKEVLQ